MGREEQSIHFAVAIRVLQAARSVEEARKLLGLNWHQVEAIKSSLVDLQGGRVLDVVEDRKEEACKALLEQSLSDEQRQEVTAVALDMWKAYANAAGEILPQADIVHDRFHISQHLNEAVDKVRRQENKELIQQGDKRLVGTKFTWLVNEERVSEEFAAQFDGLKRSDLKVSRAWALLRSCSETSGPIAMKAGRNVTLINGTLGRYEAVSSLSRRKRE